jgi:hypothetical protein
MDIPIYDGSQPISLYMLRVQEYKMNMGKSKYNEVLQFFNKLLNKKYNTLTKIKNIPKSLFINNVHKHCLIIDKYRTLFEKYTGMTINDIYDDDELLVDENYIIYCITKLLKSIGYKFTRRTIDNKCYYSIKYRKS